MSSEEGYRLSGKKLPGIAPLLFGREQCAPAFRASYPRSYWLLHFVLSGKGVFCTGNTVQTVQPGQIFVVRPHQLHYYEADACEPWHYIWVAFESDIALPQILGLDVITLPVARKLFTELLSAATMDVGQEEFVASKLWELISLLIRLENGDTYRPNPYVVRAKQFIEENYMRGIKISDITKELNLDRSYFSTLFKQQTGIAPQQYLNQYRLEQAAQLLVGADCSVAVAAYRTGYHDIANFSRMFKKHFGVAPSRYRDLILESEGLV